MGAKNEIESNAMRLRILVVLKLNERDGSMYLDCKAKFNKLSGIEKDKTLDSLREDVRFKNPIESIGNRGTVIKSRQISARRLIMIIAFSIEYKL